MNIKDLLIPLALAMLAIWGFQYFFVKMLRPYLVADQQAARTFVAPQTTQELEPLHIEVDFVDVKRPARTTLTEVDTKWAHLVFSTDGASLDRLEFKRHVNGGEILQGTIFPVGEDERENRCFLVAFDEKTPYYYQLVERKDSDAVTELTYKSDIGEAAVSKKFIIHHNLHKIDLQLAVSPKADKAKSIRPRIFYPAPVIPGIAKDDIKSAIIETQGKFEKITKDKLTTSTGWFVPELFGIDNRYYVHAMINDPDNFIQRAYYKFSAKIGLYAILEGPAATTHTAWTCSFYFGPKDVDAIMPVDARLEKTLDYIGILAPLSRFLLSLLKWLYKYLGNYGLAIIVLTFLLRLLMFPFTFKSERGKKGGAELKKKLAYLEQRYKGQPEILTQERATLIKKHGIPGLGGCLPVLLFQMPIFFVLSRLLNSSIELYQAPMLWISDLSAKDPYYILPFAVTLSMLGQAATADAQQRMTTVATALVLGAFTANFSSGLALYMVLSTFLGVLQTSLVKKFKLA